MEETGLKVLGFELGFIALRSTKKYRSTYLPSTAVFKQISQSRATDRPKDAPRDRISTLCWVRKLVNKAYFVVIGILFFVAHINCSTAKQTTLRCVRLPIEVFASPGVSPRNRQKWASRMNVASVEIPGYEFCRNVFLPWVTHPSRTFFTG